MYPSEKESLVNSLLHFKYNYSGRDTVNVILQRLNENKSEDFTLNKFLEFFKNEKERIDTNGCYKYLNYYSTEIIPTIERLIELNSTHQCVEDILVSQLDKIQLNNYDKLKEKGLINLYNDFDSDFRGKIVEIYLIKDYYVIESKDCKTGEFKYYNNKTTTMVWKSFEMAISAAIFDDNYTSVLMKLLEK